MINSSYIFKFKAAISEIEIPNQLNNPFHINISKIGQLAAKEFQEFIALESPSWTYDFTTRPGKMFGVLVIQKEDGTYGFLGAMSGNLPENKTAHRLIPSVFDETTDDFFFNKGMLEITAIGTKIKEAKNTALINELTKARKEKSFAIQQQLFENYNFLNIFQTEKNVIHIFKDAQKGKPPAAAGECAAPKLLHYAFKNKLKAIAIAEFWWGLPTKNNEKKHKAYYPACKSKCQPILEYMLNDNTLYQKADVV